MANNTKRRAIMDNYRFNADFLICQESHSTPEVENVWTSEWGGGGVLFSHGLSNARGITVFYSKEFKGRVTNIHKDIEGRLIIFDVEENGQFVSVVAIYAPNQDCPKFFTEIATLIRQRHAYKVIIGDFNLTLDVEMDRLNTYNNNNKAKEELENIMDEFLLYDVWRILNEGRKEYSWIKGGSAQMASRIDFALIASGLSQKVEAIQYITGIKTDHRALYVCFVMNPHERGIGYWKLNCSLLHNMEFIQYMNQIISGCYEESRQQDLNPWDTWDHLKLEIKKCVKKFSKQVVSEEKVVVSQLLEIVNDYESRLPLSEEEYKLLEDTRMELEEKILERTKGLMFRSKVKWWEEGEKSTKYFYALEKAKYNAKTCYKLLDQASNNEITDPKKILELEKEFYQELYKEDREVNFLMENTYGIEVPEDIRENQQEQITLQEVQIAIKKMNNGKTPGEDGIPVDFYKVFWNQLKEPFYNMMIYSFEQELLHPSARRGILNLIPKAGKDTRIIKNLRPITLLNTDYKIIEKAIANKMIPALETIIHKDQRGFMKNRRISVNIRKMLDIIHHAEAQDLEAIVLSLDFVKCFDKCSFSILHGSLSFFNFGEIVKVWTQILYRDFSVKIQNNGYFFRVYPD